MTEVKENKCHSEHPPHVTLNEVKGLTRIVPVHTETLPMLQRALLRGRSFVGHSPSSRMTKVKEKNVVQGTPPVTLNEVKGLTRIEPFYALNMSFWNEVKNLTRIVPVHTETVSVTREITSTNQFGLA